MQFGEVIRHGRERAGGLRVAQQSHGIHFVQRDPQGKPLEAQNREFQAEIMPCRNPGLSQDQ